MSDIENKGHRQRLRDHFTSGEESSRSEEALLELLLTYAIPQKDVQPLANLLLAEFGGLSTLLEAPIESLSKLEGIKENSAVLLKLVDWIRQHHAPKKPAKETIKQPTQVVLFSEATSPERSEQQSLIKEEPKQKKALTRRGTELFGKAVLKETIQILPKLPLTACMTEITDFLNKKLPFNSEQTRARRGRYVKFNMFHKGQVDVSLLKFARVFPDSRELRDVCFYQFCRAQPLMVDFIENIILHRTGAGFITRKMIEDYLRLRFPESKAIKDGTAAICEALFGADVATKKRNNILVIFRSMPLMSFAFVLHSEFPEPGMYDIRKLEENRMIRVMLWNPELILHSLYELRNRGLISKISEIDNVRQFTTKWRLEELVTRITS